jgi:hypothetical protein
MVWRSIDHSPGFAALAEVEAALGPRQGPSGLSFPIEALLVSGRR